jgi:hypothetical protein
MLSRMQIRLIMLVPQATCETAVALLNTFPLFAVMLRMKEPSRIPGGIRFVLKHIGGSEPCVLQLEVYSLWGAVMAMPNSVNAYFISRPQSQPISFAQIFARFGENVGTSSGRTFLLILALGFSGEAWRSLSLTYAPGRIFLGIIGGNL